MKIVATKPFDHKGLLCHALEFDNGIIGTTVDAAHRNKTVYAKATVSAAIVLVHGDKIGLTTMPIDWNPKVGDEVSVPPTWKV